MDTINLFVDRDSSGKPVYEELPVIDLGGSIYRLLVSPGLVLGVAKDDEIHFDKEHGQFEVLKRSGYIALQVFFEPSESQIIEELSHKMSDALSASLDGRSSKQAVFSVHVSNGFRAIEAVLDSFVLRNKGLEWYYGNVYAMDGVTPLNWWQGTRIFDSI